MVEGHYGSFAGSPTVHDRETETKESDPLRPTTSSSFKSTSPSLFTDGEKGEKGEREDVEKTSVLRELRERERLQPPFHAVSRVTSLGSAVLHMSCSSLDGTVLTLPYVFTQAGFVPSLCMVLGIAFVCSYTLHFLSRCSREMYAASYTEIVHKLLGEKSRVAFSLLLFALLFSVLLGFSLLMQHLARELLSFFFSEAMARVSRSFLAFLLLLPLLPLLLSDQMHALRFVSLFGFVAYSLLAVLLFFLSLRFSLKLSPDLQEPFFMPLWPTSPLNAMEALPVLLMLFLNHFNFLGVCSQLSYPTRERVHALGIFSESTLSVLCLCIGWSGSWLLSVLDRVRQTERDGERAPPDNVLDALPLSQSDSAVVFPSFARFVSPPLPLAYDISTHTLLWLARAMLLCALLCSAPLLLLPARSLLEELFSTLTRLSHGCDWKLTLEDLRALCPKWHKNAETLEEIERERMTERVAEVARMESRDREIGLQYHVRSSALIEEEQEEGEETVRTSESEAQTPVVHDHRALLQAMMRNVQRAKEREREIIRAREREREREGELEREWESLSDSVPSQYLLASSEGEPEPQDESEDERDRERVWASELVWGLSGLESDWRSYGDLPAQRLAWTLSCASDLESPPEDIDTQTVEMHRDLEETKSERVRDEEFKDERDYFLYGEQGETESLLSRNEKTKKKEEAKLWESILELAPSESERSRSHIKSSSSSRFPQHDQRLSMQRLVLTMLLIGSLALISSFLSERVSVVWEAIGSFLCPWIAIILPSLCFLKMRIQGLSHTMQARGVHWVRKARSPDLREVLPAIILAVLGLLMFVLCSFRTTLKIVTNE